MVATMRVAIVSSICAAAIAGGALTASASSVESRSAQQLNAMSPYAVVLDALGGQTLAGYIAAHQAADSRLARRY